jgi:hypothetical protein
LRFMCKLAGLFPDLAELFSFTGRKKISGPGNTDAASRIPLMLHITHQYRPDSRLGQLHFSRRSAARGGTPLCIGKQEVGTYIYSLLYTHTGLLGRLLYAVLAVNLMGKSVTTWAG